MDEQENIKNNRRDASHADSGIKNEVRGKKESATENSPNGSGGKIKRTRAAFGGAKNFAKRLNQLGGNGSETPKKMTGITFWIIAMLNITKDILDIPGDLTFFLAIAASVISLFVSFSTFFYLFGQDIPKETKELAYMITGAMATAEFIPAIQILPICVINLFVIRTLANNPMLKSLTSNLPLNIKNLRTSNP